MPDGGQCGEPILDAPVPRCGIVGYTIVSFAASAVPSVAAVLLWSNMGLGDTAWDFLFEHSSYQYPVGAVASIIGLGLYLLDFFCPPHLPGHYLVLWEGDRFVGRSFLVIAGCILAVAACLWPESYPQIPLIILILMSPLLVWGSRVMLKPTIVVESDKANIVDHGDILTKMKVLNNIIGDEKDEHRFFRGALAGFWITCFSILIPYMIWDRQNGSYKTKEGMTENEEALAHIKWSCPLLVALANFVYGCFVLLRIYLEQAYNSTDLYKDILEDDSRTFALHHDLSTFKRTQTGCRNGNGLNDASGVVASPSGGDSTPAGSSVRGAMSVRNMAEHASAISRIQLIVKIVVVLFMVLLGGSYVAQIALSLNKTLSEMLIGLIATILIVFFVFVWLTLGRIAKVLGQWVAEMPMYKMGKDMWQSAWCRALLAILFLPVVPVTLLVSWLNQKLRRYRGIYRSFPEQTRAHVPAIAIEKLGGDLEALKLTPRVNMLVMYVQEWDLFSVTVKAYIWCFLYILSKVSFTFASILLAECVEAIKQRDPEPYIVVGLTFMLGVALFLIPVTPGMLVYIFGGLVISPTWPEEYGGWGAGCVVNIVISWALKLLACAIQQKCIGEMLGTSLWVRQQCMLHKTFIRTLEFILKQPGWSVGKVAILCGGPDWPVSVTAGLLRLSLVQMELGTLPIILFIIPCGMAGSAYVCPKGMCMEDLATIMTFASLGVSLIQYVMIAWTAQVTLEKHHAELTKPLAKYVDLEWLDHRKAMIDEKTAIPFHEVPRLVRWMFLCGAIVHIGVWHVFFWCASNMMGEFELHDGIESLDWYEKETWGTPPKGLITNSLIGSWVLYTVGMVFFAQYFLWTSMKLAGPRKRIALELDRQEAAWKEKYVKEAENWTAEAGEATKELAKEEPTPAPVPVAWEPPSSVVELEPGNNEMSVESVTTPNDSDKHPGAAVVEEGVLIDEPPPVENSEGKAVAGDGKVCSGQGQAPEPASKTEQHNSSEEPAIVPKGLSCLTHSDSREPQTERYQADKQAFNTGENDSEKDEVREIHTVMPGRCCCGAL